MIEQDNAPSCLVEIQCVLFSYWQSSSMPGWICGIDTPIPVSDPRSDPHLRGTTSMYPQMCA